MHELRILKNDHVVFTLTFQLIVLSAKSDKWNKHAYKHNFEISTKPIFPQNNYV